MRLLGSNLDHPSSCSHVHIVQHRQWCCYIKAFPRNFIKQQHTSHSITQTEGICREAMSMISMLASFSIAQLSQVSSQEEQYVN